MAESETNLSGVFAGMTIKNPFMVTETFHPVTSDHVNALRQRAAVHTLDRWLTPEEEAFFGRLGEGSPEAVDVFRAEIPDLPYQRLTVWTGPALVHEHFGEPMGAPSATIVFDLGHETAWIHFASSQPIFVEFQNRPDAMRPEEV